MVAQRNFGSYYYPGLKPGAIVGEPFQGFKNNMSNQLPITDYRLSDSEIPILRGYLLHALYPMLYAPCSMLHALCSLLYALSHRLPSIRHPLLVTRYPLPFLTAISLTLK